MDTARAKKIATRAYNTDTCSLALDENGIAALNRRLTNRTILFVGDSTQMQFFVSFACYLHAHAGTFDLQSETIAWEKMQKNGSFLKRSLCQDAVSRCHYNNACGTFSTGVHVCGCQAQNPHVRASPTKRLHQPSRVVRVLASAPP